MTHLDLASLDPYSPPAKSGQTILLLNHTPLMADKDQRRLLIASRCSQTIFNQRIHLARMAASKGWDVAVVGEAVAGGYEDHLVDAGFTFKGLPVDQRSINPFSILRLIAAYVRVIAQSSPTVFHAFTVKPTIAGLIGARIAHVPIRFATVAGLGHIFLSSKAPVRLAAFWLFKLAFRCADKVFFYNESDREEFVSRGLLPFGKTVMVRGSGIETARFSAAPMPDGQMFRIAYVGRLLGEKGIPELIEAMQHVRRANGSVELQLIGDCDPHNPSALSREAIDAAIAEGNIVWHGHVSNIRPLISACHAVILPSHREGIPLALLEGAAMGRALIATDVPGCRDVVIHDKTGLLVPAKDPAALAHAIVELARRPDLVREMGEAARADVIERFDTKVVNTMVVDAYEAALRTLHDAGHGQA